MRKYIFLPITLILISTYAFAQVDMNYQKYVQEIERKWIEAEKKRLEEFKQQEEAKFQAFKRQEEEAYRQYVKEVKEKWNKFVGSTKQQWVDYSEDKNTRIVVNFEKKEKPEENKGQITVETLVPADEPDVPGKAKQQLAKQVEKVFSPKKKTEISLLEGQVKNQAGETVTPQNVKQFVQEEVLPEAKVEPQPIKSKDGVERVKVSVVIPMVPKHLRIRAEKYLEFVKKYSKQHNMDVPLVLAVIETESYFNPMAKSDIPAFGLMQLVPKYGGRDAYKYVFKKDKTPSPSYLYVPKNNLLLGTAYLCVLRENYLYGIKNPQKQEYLLISAYNGGIGRVIKVVLKKYNVPQMSPAEVYDALRQEMPDETKDYLAKVTSGKKKYVAWR